MAIIKCKMCGGDMEIAADKTFGTCEYCGSTMTLPKVDDEQRAAAFNRGNHFRRVGEFDKALAVYERIVADNDGDAEAHWCCALCRFGIEYVEDPATYEWIPTCHRASFDSFLEDVDYLAALEHSDGITRRQYQKDGAKIAEVQRGILATSQNEEPFDVFICYKESDENGQRTRDSLLAQEIYYQLTEQGRRVFFARITLEDKAGTEYEPYIFAALNSAKVMVAVGTKAEHFNAVWVKNEWSRFLALMRKDRGRLLLPCYRDMDPYDLPEQLSVLQSYDMAKIGFIQDLTRGISKVLDADKPEVATAPVKETVVVQQSAGGNIQALLDRGNMALEDGEWAKADGFFEEVLNQDAKCAEAYLGKALAAHKCRGEENLCDAMIGSVRKESARTVQADKENEVHIAEMVERYTVRNYLSETEIRDKYKYDFGISSEVEARSKENDAIRAAYSNDRNLTRAAQYAQSGLRQKLDGIKAQLEQKLSRRLAVAKEAETARINEKKAEYQEFLKEVDATVEDLAEGAREDREKRYQEAVEAVRNAKTIDDYSEAKELLASPKLEEYKDCAEFEARCNEAIRELKYQDVVRQVQSANTINAYNTIKRTLQADYAGYKDCDEQIKVCDAGIAKIEKREEAAAQKRRRIAGIVAAVAVAVIAVIVVVTQVIIPNGKYNDAMAMLEAGDNRKAIELFLELGDYKDAKAQYIQLASMESISAGNNFSVGLKIDGTVMAAGNNSDGQCETSWWTDIVDVGAGNLHTVGLKKDGSVVAIGYNAYGQCDVSGWENIVNIATGNFSTIGLKDDGTTIAVGKNEYGQCNVSTWTKIIDISAGSAHTVGLRIDGTVVATGENIYGQCDVSGWKDIVQIATGNDFTIGLKSDGTVVATGYNRFGQCNVSDWADVIAISAGRQHSVALKSDGTVVAVGTNPDGRCDVSEWTDIVAIDGGGEHTIGLKKDGTMVAVGNNTDGQCDVANWSYIRISE